MKKFLFMLLTGWFILGNLWAQETVRIACVGSDMTYGSGVFDASNNSYPGQLQHFMSGKATVANFGVPGATVFSGTENFYMATDQFRAALQYMPHVVFLEFGNREAGPEYMDYLSRFENEYRQLIEAFEQLPTRPKIVLLSPIPRFIGEEKAVERPSTYLNVQQIAARDGLELLNLFMLFDGRYLPHLITEEGTITSTGSYLVASRLFEELESPRTDYRITSHLSTHGAAWIDDYYSFPVRFIGDLMIVSPRQALASRPWVMAVKTMGNDPQVEIALLERGFHVVFCEPDQMDIAYRFMRKAKLSKKTVVATQEQSAAQVVKWVEKNKKKTACLYSDSLINYIPSVPTITLARMGKTPYSVLTPRPVVQFILHATGNRVAETSLPVPGNEYRWQSVGWTENSTWYDQAREIDEILSNRKIGVLLLGNSITQAFGGTRQKVTHKPGLDALNEALGELTWESAGVNSDRVQHLLWRLRNGNYAASRPDFVVVTIGVNNMGGDGDPVPEIVDGILEVVKEVHAQMPQAKIVLFGMLPAQLNLSDDIRQRVNAAHALLAKTKMPRYVTYINPTPWFVNADGSLKTEYYAGDRLHLSAEGYRMWSQHIGEIIRRLSR